MDRYTGLFWVMFQDEMAEIQILFFLDVLKALCHLI